MSILVVKDTPSGEETVLDFSVFRDHIKAELKSELEASLEPELKKARYEAYRKKNQEFAKSVGQIRLLGSISAFCDVAAFFIEKDHLDIACDVLEHFRVDRNKAVIALETDKKVKNKTLDYLDRSGAWVNFDDVPDIPEAF